mgnify:CR=1 FL=1
MSKEIKEIIKDEDELIVLYKDNSHRTFDTLTVDVIDYIINLEQENQQLKEELKNHTTIVNYAYDLSQQRDNYKSVLDEIREYIDEFIIYVDEDGEVYFKEEFRTEYNDLLEILDKVGSNEYKKKGM